MALQLDIVTPERTFFTGPADEVRAPGVHGEFGILPDHALFLSLLKAGIVTVTVGGSTRRVVVGRGFAEAGPDRVVLLTDLAEDVDQVDKGAAQKALEHAERVLVDSQPDSEERLAAEREAELARARLEA